MSTVRDWMDDLKTAAATKPATSSLDWQHEYAIQLEKYHAATDNG